MPFTVREINKSDLETFRSLMQTIWTANHHPYQPYFAAYFPVFRPTAADRERGFESCTVMKWEAHRNDPSSHWIYAVGSEHPNIIVGVCQWRFHMESPYPKPGKPDGHLYDASMWPEGSTGREFVGTMMRKQYGHRARWLRRKHADFLIASFSWFETFLHPVHLLSGSSAADQLVVCHWMSVLPSFRGRGIGSRLMDWGMKRAEDLSLEVFLHGTDIGRGLYERSGLRVVQKIEVDMTRQDPSDEWEMLRHNLGPLRFSLMWKPCGGIYEDGVTELPWEA